WRNPNLPRKPGRSQHEYRSNRSPVTYRLCPTARDAQSTGGVAAVLRRARAPADRVCRFAFVRAASVAGRRVRYRLRSRECRLQENSRNFGHGCAANRLGRCAVLFASRVRSIRGLSRSGESDRLPEARCLLTLYSESVAVCARRNIARRATTT